MAQPPLAGIPSAKLADPLLQFTQNGNPQYRYLNGPTPAGVDAVMGEEGITTPGQAGTDYWSLGDQVNTPHETVNNASTVVDHVITNTFGVVTSESNTSIHHWAGFGGGHFDPDSALVNDDHRWYDPTVGRWISEDPIGFNGGDANLDCYVGNGPVSQIDSVGEAPPNQGPVSHYLGTVDGHAIYTPINLFVPVAHSSGTTNRVGGANWTGTSITVTINGVSVTVSGTGGYNTSHGPVRPMRPTGLGPPRPVYRNTPHGPIHHMPTTGHPTYFQIYPHYHHRHGLKPIGPYRPGR